MGTDLKKIARLMALCRARKASDRHRSTGKRPYLREHGILHPVEDAEAITNDDLEAMARALMNEKQWDSLQVNRDMDIAYSPESGGRFRINVYYQQNGMAIATIIAARKQPRKANSTSNTSTMPCSNAIFTVRVELATRSACS